MKSAVGLCKYMRWSWQDYLAAPLSVLEAVGELIDDEVREQQKAKHHRSGRR